MTTEAGSEAEVKTDPEPEEQQVEAPGESAQNPDTEPQPASENPEDAKAEPVEPTSPSPSSSQKKDKGISRFLPSWGKRQKSLSQVESKDTPTQTQEEEEPKGEGAAPERKDEQNSVCSTETQPAKEAESEKKGGDGEDTAVVIPHKPKVKKMKMVVCHVTLLDGNQFQCEIEKRAKGQVLFQEVCGHLNLLEKDYFGLSFKDNADQRCWLDPNKEIKHQIRNSQWQFAFNVKFYPPDPAQLSEDITRYLLCLQLRQDIVSGRLPCSFVTLALLGSYTLQAELGDQDSAEPHVHAVSDFQLAKEQTKELEEKVLELYKSHRGMSPAQADINFLENAKKLSMYGVDLHQAKDSEGVDIMLGVCSSGLLIYKDRLRINRFAWPKILKISYKRSNFYIKIRPGEADQFESTVGFKLPNYRAAKRVWKVCVEHHTFFRLTNPEQPTKSKFLTLGSKFRYSGRTQAQTRQASSLIDRPSPHFVRTASKRSSRSLDTALVSDRGHAPGENGRDPALDLSSDSKIPQVEEGAEPVEARAGEVGAELVAESKLRVQGENIYVRHSNLMLEDLDKTQEDVLRHQASISELKRSFMEAAPEPRPSQWEKRLTGSPVSTSLRPPVPGISPAHLESALSDISDISKNEQNSGLNGQPEVIEVVEENKSTDEAEADKPQSPAPDVSEVVTAVTQKAPEAKEEEVEPEKSGTSESESEDEAEYHAQLPASTDSTHVITEEPEEVELTEEVVITAEVEPQSVHCEPVKQEETQAIAEEEVSGNEVMVTLNEAPNGHSDDPESPPAPCAIAEEPCFINGDSSHAETERVPQVICCSEPPVVKTEMVTISDTFAAQKTEITTKEVPIVHTETKTITYEAAQLDGAGDGEPGVLMTAQTITSESLCTTTTTHITKTLKDGVSETRIEKRIVITGDSDIDHDEALAQAIKEAKEQHPDMSVTRVVVHKETELAEEDE
ncbi:band 4.1-like protein 2 isoform 1-T2 [Clarias gariepinus]|uniref:band 4.1-like protein 2 isoform X3 n=1 Tax=Clarias gariepinus TaxID=13013 RepID=UPI00234CDFD6|nr:band 4.1-like protein 2 isoform X3 [Clarias gariepinus]